MVDVVEIGRIEGSGYSYIEVITSEHGVSINTDSNGGFFMNAEQARQLASFLQQAACEVA